MNNKIINGKSYYETLKQIPRGFRPATIKELMQERIQNPELRNEWVDSCSAIVYSGDGKFKIIQKSDDLLNLSDNKDFLVVDYDLIAAKEFIITNLKMMCKSKKEIINHPVWLELAGGNKELLQSYADLFSEKSEVSIFFREQNKKGELRALYLGNLDFNSIVYGNNILNNNSRFLLVADEKKQKSLLGLYIDVENLNSKEQLDLLLNLFDFSFKKLPANQKLLISMINKKDITNEIS